MDNMSLSHNTSQNVLNRFTEIPCMLHILRSKKIVFTDPNNWPDKNDVKSIKKYERDNKSKILTFCCCNGRETIYHWTAFSNNRNGCCIEFDKKMLIHCLEKKNNGNIKKGLVKYIKIDEFEEKVSFDSLPFIKRFPYRNENEYRFIYETKDNIKNKEIDIDLQCIRKITLSAKLDNKSFETLKGIISQFHTIEVNKSTIYENEHWINKLDIMRV